MWSALVNVLSKEPVSGLLVSQINQAMQPHSNHPPHYKTLTWLTRCLEAYTVSSHLLTIASHYHLLFDHYSSKSTQCYGVPYFQPFYHPPADAFVCRPIFFDAMFTIMQALETHDPVLLTSVNLYKVTFFYVG